MSISLPFAVTMMIGTRDFARISRHTSRPDIRGNITSSRTRSGVTSVEHVERRQAVACGVHQKAFALEPHHQRVDEAVLVFDDQDARLVLRHVA